MKLSLSERKKLERRLPLWESSIVVAEKSDFTELKKKIDNARKALNMPDFDYRDLFIKGKANSEIIANKEVKTVTGLRKKLRKEKEELFSLDEIFDMKNKLCMSDEEIAQKMKISIKTFNSFKKENFIEKFRLKDNEELTVNRYCNIKNETRVNDIVIMRMFGIKHRETMTRIKKKTELKYRIKQEINIMSDEYIQAKKLWKLLEKDKINCRTIAERYGVSESQISILKKRYLIQLYQPKEFFKLTPEIYCHCRNDLLMSDKEIMEKYGISTVAVINRIKDKFLENYFERLEEK